MVALLALSATGCGDDDECGDADGCNSPDSSTNSDSNVPDASADDAAAPDSTTPPDASSDAQVDAQADAGDPMCSFNRNCPQAERCECVEGEGCYCKLGERGTGELNDPCEDGNGCASSVCLEGPDDKTLCSIECNNGDDCGGDLPLCQEILFVGKVCTREPPA